MQEIQFDYFRGMEAEQYSFYRVPKVLFTEECFKSLSCEAKILYGLMLDRMSLSIKNRWFDEKDRVYIIFTVEEIMELLGCGRQKAIKNIAELDSEKGIGLIEKKRLGLGKPNVIYVKNFMIKDCPEPKREEIGLENAGNTQKYENQTSRSPENKLQEVCKSNSNYNNLSYNKENDNESDQIRSADVRSDDRLAIMQAYEEQIKDNIDYDGLIISHSLDKDLIQGIYELILETVLCQNQEILIASNWYPAELVKSKFLKLEYSHIEYVIECLKKNTSKVKNIKKYMLAALFNAPATIDGYYQAEVNHDMPQFA